MKKPIIGLTADWNTPGQYSKVEPWYAMRENHCATIADAGGIPVILPHHMDMIDEYIRMVDGLIITGGKNDIDPTAYGQAAVHPSVIVKAGRSNFEIALTKKALDLDMPILGICGGHQVLNVVLGGSLYQHIPDEFDTDIEHNQKTPPNRAQHDITVHKNTLLHRIMQLDQPAVNSAHHQAVKDVGPDVLINAVATDGLIEGIEATNQKFCLGVQWHPEFLINEGDGRIFSALIQAATR